MPTKTEAIARFLNHSTHSDLANLYHYGMECQVNVAQDNGERINGDYRGRKWNGWTDGITTWKSFRIPWNAMSEPEFNDTEIKFDLAEHVEAIGMTGWNWEKRLSEWVAFDFDAITGHSDKHGKKLTSEELHEIQKAAYDVSWVTIRKSTSGKGLHLYVFVDNVPTENHSEHAALARSILGTLSAITGFDFASKVDVCGSNMWVWHRKMRGTQGLKLIKEGEVLTEIPTNWKDHLNVIKGSSRRIKHSDIEEREVDEFEDLCSQRTHIQLDEEHKKLFNYLREHGGNCWWDTDNHLLVAHTSDLKKAHEDLNCRGYFETLSEGREHGDYNCFLFPLRNGAWGVRRYTRGVNEHPSWDQDGSGWTRCYFNKEPDFRTACRAKGGIEDTKGGFMFREAEIASEAARLLGVSLNFHPSLNGRQAVLKQHKDGRLICEIDKQDGDNVDMQGWLAKGNKPWTRIYNTRVVESVEPEVPNHDDIIRHIVSEQGEDCGWTIKSEGMWRREPLNHIKQALLSLGYSSKECSVIVGSSIFKAWILVNKPFQPEYPGNRRWNRNAVQIRFAPSENTESLEYGTWQKVLKHCGSGLDQTVKHNAWCRANGIITGADYLKCWIASFFQEPEEPLPFLFFYGPQNSGKSIFHEALSVLLTTGYKRADAALTSQSGFNAELEGTVLNIIEETDLRKNTSAYNKIKDWVTSREILLHRKGETPYHIPNTTHWVQCANDHQACPIFPGDTRITMCYVEPLEPLDLIPKKRLLDMLEKEAPDFIAEVLRLEIPESNDRLHIPVIETEDKVLAQEMNQTPLERFIEEKCMPINGHMIKFSDLYERFIDWVDPDESRMWTKQRVGKSLPPQYPKGRRHKDMQFYVGNIGWVGTDLERKDFKYVSREKYLEEVPIND